MPVTSDDVIATWDLMMDETILEPSSQLVYEKYERPVAESKYIVSVTSKSLNWRNLLYFSASMSLHPHHILKDIDGTEYLEKYEMKVVENDIINIHGALGEWLDDIYETQQMIVGTKSMPGEEWVKTRVFGYVVAFLHFNKLFQIPFIIANSVYDVDY